MHDWTICKDEGQGPPEGGDHDTMEADHDEAARLGLMQYLMQLCLCVCVIRVLVLTPVCALF